MWHTFYPVQGSPTSTPEEKRAAFTTVEAAAPTTYSVVSWDLTEA